MHERECSGMLTFKGCLYHLFRKLWHGKQSWGPSTKMYVSISASVPHGKWMEVEQKILGCCRNERMQCPGKLQKWVLRQCSGNYSLAGLCKLSKPAAILLRIETTSLIVKVYSWLLINQRVEERKNGTARKKNRDQEMKWSLLTRQELRIGEEAASTLVQWMLLCFCSILLLFPVECRNEAVAREAIPQWIWLHLPAWRKFCQEHN